jgi:hypothetical protein
MLNPLNKRPTQAPLNREEQAKQFEALKHSYLAPPPEKPPVFPLQPQVIDKPSETSQLKEFQQRLAERGLEETAKKIEARVEENKTAETVKQFYCNHSFTPVRAVFMSLPIRYKICSKCGLVK